MIALVLLVVLAIAVASYALGFVAGARSAIRRLDRLDASGLVRRLVLEDLAAARRARPRRP